MKNKFWTDNWKETKYICNTCGGCILVGPGFLRFKRCTGKCNTLKYPGQYYNKNFTLIIIEGNNDE